MWPILGCLMIMEIISLDTQIHNHTHTLKSTRLCTLTELGLCCLLWCIVMKGHGTPCFQLWGAIMKDQRKTDIKARLPSKHKAKEALMNNKKAKNTKWGGEKLRNWDYKVWKDLWNCFGRFMKLLEIKVQYHEIEVCHMSSWFEITMN